MNCHKIEELLPAYLENDLASDERSQVATHLDTCTECQQAVAQFKALESALVMRREAVPTFERFLPALSTMMPAPVRQYARAQRWLNVIFSTPGLASLAFVVLGLFMFTKRELMTSLLDGWVKTEVSWQALGQSLQSLGQSLNQAILVSTGGDMIILSVIYGLLTVTILLFTALITMRYVK